MKEAPLDCIELVELVTDYLEGAVDEQLRTRIEDHLAICPGCAEYVRQTRETARLAGAPVGEVVDPVFRARLLAAFREWREP